ncbi:Oidioi.mRNA.OKI2018_I69.chr1.g206.t1.cds [Oikopleura dioica]|uniref:Oidioi.mRNA.OKI2018_I69.chr1.g206.t1.cds n=1 Tax=Oikopleura dioica TaxID=34765 RepID=A0ABN7SNC8_OIKDI|nr:Oidioi.mRNA.OKI2018_I69.chr1.g206.t1.cds [Oikopleura dioica]
MKFAFGLVAAASALQPVPVIIGGSTASPHSQPYILSLQRSGSHFCGGSLGGTLSKGITAAHCYQTSVTAVAGAHNIKQNESTQQKKSVSSFVRHPNYNSRNQQNDIAVLKWSGSFSSTSAVKYMSLPAAQNREWMPHGANVRVCGWGNTSTGIIANYPSELKCVNVNIIRNSICNDRSHYNGSILSGMFCAGILDVGGKDACQGDSGGPVVYNNQMVGATSWGIGCAEAKYPGVYTDVAIYKNWINAQ